MRSLKLWHYLLTVAIIVIAISLTVKHMFGNDTRWQRLGAIGLQNKISIGIEQIYWQWQAQGRPERISYQPAHAKYAVNIEMGPDGKPQFEVNQDNCTEFLNWFIQDLSFERYVKVSARAEAKQEALASKLDYAKQQVACDYILANNHFAYDMQNAQLITYKKMNVYE